MLKHEINKAWLIGVGLNITGSLFINFSATLLKYTHIYKHHAQKKVHSNPKANCRAHFLWFLSNTIFLVGNILNFVSFAYAAQTMLAALGSIQFISNIVFAYFLLNESVTLSTLLGTALILVGNVIVVLYSSHMDISYKVRDLETIFTGTIYGWYIVWAALVCVVLLVIQYWLKWQWPGLLVLEVSHDELTEQEQEALEDTCLISSVKLQTVPRAIRRLDALVYVLVSGIIGTQAVTYAKAMSIVVRQVIAGDTRWLNWHLEGFTYYILILWTFCMGFWLVRRERMLRAHETTFIIPVLQVVWITLTVIQGGVYFGEFHDYTPQQTYMFAIGMSILICGVIVLTIKSPDSGNTDTASSQGSTTEYEKSSFSSADSGERDTDRHIMHRASEGKISLGLATSLPMPSMSSTRPRGFSVPNISGPCTMAV